MAARGLEPSGRSGNGKHGESFQSSVTPRNSEAPIFEALQQFIRYLKDERQASPHTLDAYERDLLRFTTELEARGREPLLALVTAEDIRDHMHRLLDRHLSKATVRRSLHALGSFFRWAVRWGLVPTSPVDRVTVPRRESVREVRALSKRERAVLIAAADKVAAQSLRLLSAQLPLLVRCLLKMGLRRGELLDLTWRDVDLTHQELLVRHGKGNKSRRVPIEDPDLIERLRRLHAERQINEGSEAQRVFVSGRGTRISHSSFYRIFHRVLAAAELMGTGITPHSLRHTFGSVLCARGVPVPYVKDLLGHADISSTMVYVHSTPQALRQAVRKLSE